MVNKRLRKIVPRVILVSGFVFFLLSFGVVGRMDSKNEKLEVQAQEYNYQAQIMQMQDELMRLQVTVDGMSEDLYTLLDKVVYEGEVDWEPIGDGN